MRLRRGCWRLLVGAVTLSTGGALALGVAQAAGAQAATMISLFGVSCAGAAACEAVGNYANSSGVQETLAEVLNGAKTGRSRRPPTRPAAQSPTWPVCRAPVRPPAKRPAAGSYTNSSGVGETLAEVWNGASRAVQKTPNPSGSTVADLAGVSCTGVSACETAGSYTNSSGDVVTLAEVWNGTKWAVQATPNPSGGTENILSGLSCTGAAACEAGRLLYQQLG